MHKQRFGLLVFFLAVLSPSVCSAQTTIKLMYTAANNFIATFVAQDQGLFAKHGLSVDLSLAQNGGLIPPALLADTVQIGAPTVTTFLQAVDQGLDLAVVAGSNVYTSPAVVQSGVVVRKGGAILKASDLIGKKFAVSSFGGAVDILSRRWVQTNGIDPHQVNWVEIPFPQMGDALKGGIVDAAAAVNPFYAHLIDNDIGQRIGDFGAVQPPGTSLSVYIATRAWAAHNAAAVQQFRAALDDAVAFIGEAEHKQLVLGSLAKYTKLPPQAAATLTIPEGLQVHATPASLTFWIEVAQQQGLIKSNPEPASLILP